jgi:peptidoglycan/LPS O-acetylase OafA/YrhL
MTTATHLLPTRTESAQKPRERPSRLPGVDGIRALAVSAVVLYHLDSGWLPGGYLGVDVFFVVSGYLITRLLVTEQRGTGRTSLQHFWTRRARRILPPLFPMLLVTVVGTALIDRSMLHNLRTEVFGALTYTSNWVQIAQHDSYFAKFDAPSALQHLWSLAVEEQFYLVWPLLVVALLWWGRRRLALVAGLGAVASAAAMAAMYEPGSDPSQIYYSTMTHSAGLLVGAVLAIAWPAKNAPRTPGKIKASAVLSVIGLVGIGIGFCLFDECGAAPYRGGIFTVSVASALLIVGAGHGQTAVGRLLSRPLVVWLGARSYGLYLWHWPVLVLGDRFFGHRGPVAILFAVAVSLLLAAASYRWIEQPVQRHGYGGAFVIAKRWLFDGGSSRCRAATFGVAALAATCAFAGVSLLRASPPPLNGLEDQLASAQLAIEKASRGAPPTVPGAHPVVAAGALCETPPPPGSQISALGDSVMLAGTQGLLTSLPGIDINAATNRAMQAASTILDGRVRDGTLRPVVLLGLGTNGPFPRAMLDRIIDQLGPTRTVYLVNVYLQSRPWTTEVNDTLAAVAHDRPNVHLVDWQATAGAHPDLLYSDGIHPRPGAGADLYARMVVSTMTHHKRCPRIAQNPPKAPRPSANSTHAVSTHADSNATPASKVPEAATRTTRATLDGIGTFRVPMAIVLAVLLLALIRIRAYVSVTRDPVSAALSSTKD